VGEPLQRGGIALSPDETRAAVSETPTTESGNLDIWVYEFAHATRERLTRDSFHNMMPVWSPDGSRIVCRRAGRNLVEMASNGVGSVDVLLALPLGNVYPSDWSGDNRFLLYSTTTGNLWSLPLQAGDRNPVIYLKTQTNPIEAQFSPDGHYVAYTSGETGRNEIYVRPFPQAGAGKWPISTSGGTQPRWRRDGKELFYISGDSKMMAVSVTTTPQFRKIENPRALFTAPVPAGGTGVFRYDTARDGRKFLVDALVADSEHHAPITIVLNWPTLMEK
jgi:Tol biopolymer transport system component